METTNIFRIASSELGPEDKFTAFLHYLIHNTPSIGQRIIDVICQKSGLAPATFDMAIDHPPGDSENKPDFMLSCKEFDILCEHKLDSDLGDRQLERYLGLLKDWHRTAYLVLITGRNHTIQDEVLQSNNYLRPKDSAIPFFCWEDFYPIIASHSERLAQDFLIYMNDLGIAPCPLPGDWVQLFQSRIVADGFYEATKELRSYFTQMGAQCQADPSRLGCQVKYPINWLHLLYFYVSKVAKPTALGVEPPYLIARVFIRKAEVGHIMHLGTEDICTADGLIVGRALDEIATWDKSLTLRYEYIGSLKNYLVGNPNEIRAKLLSFGQAVFEHVTNESQ